MTSIDNCYSIHSIDGSSRNPGVAPIDQALLFALPEPDDGARAEGVQAPVRVQHADRRQVRMLNADLDSLLARDHKARTVWAFVELQDLSALYDAIGARVDTPGRTPIDPRILMGLWLLATLDGVGSAREVGRRCQTDLGYQWLCGGVSVNAIYRERAKAECIDARARMCTFTQFAVRGLQ